MLLLHPPASRALPQNMMIMLGEAVGFVADVLQQTQGVGVAVQPHLLCLV